MISYKTVSLQVANTTPGKMPRRNLSITSSPSVLRKLHRRPSLTKAHIRAIHNTDALPSAMTVFGDIITQAVSPLIRLCVVLLNCC